MTITAIAFDLDGTLVDSVQDLARAANAMRAEMGLPALDPATVESYVGDGAASLVARTLRDSHAAEFSGSEDEKRAMELFNSHYRAGLTIATKFYPRVQEVLHTLHERGVPLAIVTNKPERFTLPLLRELGVFEHFDAVISGDTASDKKPSAAPILLAAERLGVPVEGLLMVGDSKNDILAGRNAGCPVVAVSYGYGEVESLGADAVIHDFRDLLEFIDSGL
ncbi:phosphoglycolate phosphatase [Chitinilyticum piscinae]|uniref:Phosphoglycolate phosphatase n=1 Tax=Chitinilyticum piscinae TaxID=2866724 RepID=A0A8J7FR05_9NEIS|nr:phosphoglycolate phosphatase [Chitinilyticum piscinae]MBE9610724.1 phosphoglycolate phosphatase [Chitinilyticum piscinae]